MKQLGKFRVFAGHYQFILCDADWDDELPRWSKADHSRGYMASDSCAFVTSMAALNSIVVVVELSDSTPKSVKCDRHLSFDLELPSGKMYVTSLDGLGSSEGVKVPRGKYHVHVFSYNLGVDEVSTGEMLKEGYKRPTDKERFAREDYEHHRVVLVPERE